VAGDKLEVTQIQAVF